MEKLNFKKMLNLKSFTLIAILVVALIATSCNKENDGYIPEEVASGQDIELKKGRPDGVPKAAPAPGDASIASIAIDAGFSELVSALAYVDAELNAGLVNLFLNGKDQYTVFAPTNEAFEALYNAAGADEISDLPATLVLDVLLYHVTEGRRAANSVVPPRGTRTIETLLDGARFFVDPSGNIDAVGSDAGIITPNISASNGIIHVIDTVLLPVEL